MKGLDSGAGSHPYPAHRASVIVDDEGLPTHVGGREVTSIRESWLVEEGWWSSRPLHRHYFELVTVSGSNLTVFRSLPEGAWFVQRA